MKKTPPQKPKGGWIISMAAGMVILNFPFIHIFNSGGFFLGLPTLLIYIFLAWAILISGLLVYSQFSCRHLDQDNKEMKQRKDQQ